MLVLKPDPASAALQELLAPRGTASAMAQITCQPAAGPAFQGAPVSADQDAGSGVDMGAVCKVESMDELAHAGARTIYRRAPTQPVGAAVRDGVAGAGQGGVASGEAIEGEGSNERINPEESTAAAVAATAAMSAGDMCEIAESKSMSSTGVAENTASAANVSAGADTDGSKDGETCTVCGSGSSTHRSNGCVREASQSKGEQKDGSLGVRASPRVQASGARLSSDNMLVC